MLGKEATDIITGFKGIITGCVQYLTGCQQLLLTPKAEKGNRVQPEWFDIDRVKVTNKPPLRLGVTAAGFDKPAPRR